MKHGAAFNTNPTRPCVIGAAIVLATFGVFGLWSGVAPLQSAVLALGTVTVKGSRKSIEHLEGGIVAELAVRDGATVTAGDLLIRLDDTQTRAQLEMAMGQYYAAKAREARLLAERDNRRHVRYAAGLAESEDPRAVDARQSQTQVFEARRNARLGEIAVLRQKIEQFGAQRRGAIVLKASKQKLIKSYSEEIRDYAALLADGFADKQRLRKLGRDRARTEGEVAVLIADIARLERHVGEAKLHILQLQKDLHTAVVAELGTTQSEVYDLEERIRALADRADRTEIRSPVGGVIMGMTVTTLGEVVRPGEPLLYVVPQAEEMIVHAKVKPADIDRVQGGQSAAIRFSAFKSLTTPVIDGTVASVSADVLHDANTGAAYYLARVAVTPEGSTMLNQLTLVPGMPAEVLINTGSRTLFQYLTQPMRNTLARAMLEE